MPTKQNPFPKLVTALRNGDQATLDDFIDAVRRNRRETDAVAAVVRVWRAEDERLSPKGELPWPSMVRFAALNVLVRIGPAVVPALAKGLSDHDSRVRSWAAMALGRFGPDAGPAVPQLVEALRAPDAPTRSNSARALGTIGAAVGEATPALAEALRDLEAEVREVAADSLGKLGPAAKEVVPALIEALATERARLQVDSDEGKNVRLTMAEALLRIGGQPGLVIPAFIEGLGDEFPDERKRAADLLGEIGPRAKTAVAALLQTCKREAEPSFVRDAAAEALWRIDPRAAARAKVPRGSAE